MKEREIDLFDLFVEILLHWRIFIIWMLFGAILLGAYSFVHSSNDIKVQQSRAQVPEEYFSEEEMQNVNYVAAYEAIYQAEQTYLEESPLMKIDSNHVCKAEATIAIAAKNADKSGDIKKIYEDILQSSELITYVSENLGIDAVGLDEMILLTPDLIPSNFSTSRDTLNITVNESNITSFRIIVKYNNETQCQNILDSIISFLNDKQPAIENVFGEYKFSIADTSIGVVSDKEIADKQKTVLDNISTMRENISNVKAAFSNAEQQYYTLLISDIKTDSEQIPSSEPVLSPSVSIKYVLLGAVIAAFFYALWLFIVYIFNTRIRYTDNLQELYDIPQLGLISAPNSNKKFFGFIDKWFLSLRYRNKRQFTLEEVLELTSVAIKISAGKENLQEISLIGCGIKDRTLDVCEKIQRQLARDNIRVNILNNVLYDARTMNELENAKGVILVEGVASTLYNEIVEELDLLKRQEIIVLGGILVE